MSPGPSEDARQVLFLMPVVSQVRYHKRVKGLVEQGWNAHALAFERPYYEGKDPAFPVTRLGKVVPGRYGSRAWPLLKALPKVIQGAATARVAYAFGLDMGVLAALARGLLGRRIRVVYEVGDIRRVLLGDGVVSRALRCLDRWLCRNADVIVVTSGGYVRGYFQEVLGMDDLRKFQVVENKLPRDYDARSSSKTVDTHHGVPDGVVRIGYFGLLRCPRTLEILLRASKLAQGRLKVLIRGYPLDIPDLEERVAQHDWVEYGGPYVAPDELAELYSNVDLVWGCYPYEGTGAGNWRWARTNRFYEACAFGVPLLSSRGSEESRIVIDLGIGTAIDLSDVDGAVESLIELDSDQVEKWKTQAKRLEERVYLDLEDHVALSDRLVDRHPLLPGARSHA